MYSQQAHIRPHAPYRANTDDHNPYKDLYPNGQFLAPPTPQLGYQISNEYSPASQKSDPLISYEKKSSSRRTLYKRGLWIGIAGLVLALVIALPLGLQHRFDDKKASSAKNLVKTGGDGSVVTMADGSTFIYNNSYGGFWVEDPKNPWNNSARPNSWTKPLTEKWDFVNDQINGVNLGGWFVLEPFITPEYYQRYNGSLDEWTLSEMMAKDTASGGLDQIEKHYATFITEKDIAQIAAAGLNWVRLPIPYWAIDKWGDEPFLAQKAWPYIVQALKWCRKYGIRVNLDLHTIPGSQNGYNHSGRLGPNPNWMYGIMGLANAQRSLDYMRTIVEFISQPEYVNVVQIFSPVNEALLLDIGIDMLARFYSEMHNMIRNVTGVGEGAWIAIHDGFQGPDPWRDFLPGADRLIMDTHPYLSFSGADAMRDPFSNGLTGQSAGFTYALRACQAWGNAFVTSQSTFGVTIAGEFSNGWNDCGLFLQGIPPPGLTIPQSYPYDCSTWTAYQYWGQDVKDGLQNYALASMDAHYNWFFWTWKIAPAANGTILSPLWSYQLGLEEGWMPKDPRKSNGTCSSFGYDIQRFNKQYQAYQTGGGNGIISASVQAAFGQWPPQTLSGYPTTMDFASAPVYTASGSIPTLKVTYPATITPASTATGKNEAAIPTANGWFNSKDDQPRYTPISDCVYPDAWTIGPMTTVVCSGSATATRGTASGTIGAIVPPPTLARLFEQSS